MSRPHFALSVDYGTSNTVAVLRWPDGRVRPLLFDGSPLLPSAVLATSDGRVMVGRDAEQGRRLDPARYEPNPKRMVDAGAVLLGERAFPVTELIAAVLRRVGTEATRTAGEHPAQVTLTYPAAWGPARRHQLETAAGLAGLAQPTLVPEPVAAATYFAEALGHRVAVGQSVVVYDLGGGTFDVSVVRRAADGFETVAYDGIEDFGGVDLDAVVVAQVAAVVEPSAPDGWRRLQTPANDIDRRNFRLFWEDAMAAKEMLSRQPVAAIHVPVVERQVHLTREEFERAARPALERTVDVTNTTLEQWSPQWRDTVAGLFLVGGSSRIPLVATLLHQRLGIAPTAIEQPEIVVADGGLRLTPPPVDVDAVNAVTVPDAPVLPAATEAVDPAGRRRVRLAAGVVVLLVAALGAAAAIWFQGDAAGTAFDGSSELRQFAAAFIDQADHCAEPPLRTHKQETGIDVAQLAEYRAIARCTGEGWTAYFYDAGPADDPSGDLRSNLYLAVHSKADRKESWGPRLDSERPPPGESLPTVVRLAAGQEGSTAIYWEPADADYETAIAGLVLGRDVDRIRQVWRDYAH